MQVFRNWFNKHKIDLFIGLVFVCYIIMHGNIRKENVDDPWVLSWVYNFINHGIEADQNYMLGRPGSGLELFFKTYAYIYGTALNFFGWDQANVFWISSLFVLMGGVIWYFSFRRLGISEEVSKIAVAGFLFLEPFVYVGNLARADALCFFIVSAGYYIFLRGNIICAGALVGIAFESHPMGVMLIVYMGAYLLVELQRSRSLKVFIKQGVLIAFGISIGSAYYFALHWETLQNFMGFVAPMRGTMANNFIFKYFFLEKYMRHLPELLFVALGSVFFLRSLWREEKTERNMVVVFTAMSCIFASLIINREISLYIIYIYPWLMVMTVLGFEQIRKKQLITVIILLLMVPQYMYAYKLFSGYDLNRYIQEVQARTAAYNMPILGHSNSWYAFKDKDWHEYTAVTYGKLPYDEMLIIENENYINYTEGRKEQWKEITRLYPSTVVDEFECNGETIRIRVFNRRTNE